jgi:hypothetical protein
VIKRLTNSLKTQMANPKPNLNNLTPFKKGNRASVGKGRPPKLPHLDKLLDEVLGEEKNNMTAMKAVVLSLLNKAVKGDVRAAEILLERAYGKAKQAMDITTGGSKVMLIPTIEIKKDE